MALGRLSKLSKIPVHRKILELVGETPLSQSEMRDCETVIVCQLSRSLLRDIEGVRHPPQSGWLGEWGRLKGGCPVGLGVALKRAFVDEFRSCRYYHPRPLVRGCICKLAPTRNPPWTLRIHGPRSARS